MVAEVQNSVLNEPITDEEDELTQQQLTPEHHQKVLSVMGDRVLPKICVEDESEDHLRTTNEEEELSEYWDQVIYQYLT